jgi:hypothetical protein
MLHISQLARDGDCGVCAIGMVIDQSYEEVMKSTPPDVVPHGLWIPEVCHIIKKRTGKDVAVVTYNKDLPQLSQYDFGSDRAIYGVLRIEAGNVFHYVVSDGEYFHDPMLPQRISVLNAKTDYHSGWAIVCKISGF